MLALSNTAGIATSSLTIPLNPQLHGAVFYHQAIVLEPGLQPMFVSNGAIATIGR